MLAGEIFLLSASHLKKFKDSFSSTGDFSVETKDLNH
jgi:hypothetical protein